MWQGGAPKAPLSGLVYVCLLAKFVLNQAGWGRRLCDGAALRGCHSCLGTGDPKRKEE